MNSTILNPIFGPIYNLVHLSTYWNMQPIYQPNITFTSNMNMRWIIIRSSVFWICGSMIIFFSPLIFIYLVFRFWSNNPVSNLRSLGNPNPCFGAYLVTNKGKNWKTDYIDHWNRKTEITRGLKNCPGNQRKKNLYTIWPCLSWPRFKPWTSPS